MTFPPVISWVQPLPKMEGRTHWHSLRPIPPLPPSQPTISKVLASRLVAKHGFKRLISNLNWLVSLQIVRLVKNCYYKFLLLCNLTWQAVVDECMATRPLRPPLVVWRSQIVSGPESWLFVKFIDIKIPPNWLFASKTCSWNCSWLQGMHSFQLWFMPKCLTHLFFRLISVFSVFIPRPLPSPSHSSITPTWSPSTLSE